MSDFYDQLKFHRERSLERTARRGFVDASKATRDGQCLQAEWRKTDCRRDPDEIMDAIIDGLTQEGIPAWPGDATSIVEQMVRVQYNRAEKALAALDKALAVCARLSDPLSLPETMSHPVTVALTARAIADEIRKLKMELTAAASTAATKPPTPTAT